MRLKNVEYITCNQALFFFRGSAKFENSRPRIPKEEEKKRPPGHRLLIKYTNVTLLLSKTRNHPWRFIKES